MQIEIWSDVVCPWCYIGTRRLERALDGFAHRDEVEVVYRSFELDPSAPAVPDGTVVEMLARKYAGGDVAAAREMIARTDAIAAEEGLEFHHADAPHVAHRRRPPAPAPGPRGVWSRDPAGAQARAAGGVLHPCGERRRPHVLRAAASRVGLDAARVEEVLAGDEYADAVQRTATRPGPSAPTGCRSSCSTAGSGSPARSRWRSSTQALQQAWDARHAMPSAAVRSVDLVHGPLGCPPAGQLPVDTEPIPVDGAGTVLWRTRRCDEDSSESGTNSPCRGCRRGRRTSLTQFLRELRDHSETKVLTAGQLAAVSW